MFNTKLVCSQIVANVIRCYCLLFLSLCNYIYHNAWKLMISMGVYYFTSYAYRNLILMSADEEIYSLKWFCLTWCVNVCRCEKVCWTLTPCVGVLFWASLARFMTKTFTPKKEEVLPKNRNTNIPPQCLSSWDHITLHIFPQ